MSIFTESIRPVFLYTMTAGLGDFIIMGDLARKIESVVPSAKVVFAHRNNPHVQLWDHDNPAHRFFNVFSISEIWQLAGLLSGFHRAGYTIFGLQMAPGSLQGYLFLSTFKKLSCVDYVVDFNLVNADIITPPAAQYILDLHLRQIAELAGVEFLPDHFRLSLPFHHESVERRRRQEGLSVGIHPWSRRGYLESYVWKDEKWLALVKSLLASGKVINIVLLGKDKRFEQFAAWLKENLGDDARLSLSCTPSQSVDELVRTVSSLDMLITVNTALVHIGYAINLPMVVLCGPSLDIWTPKSERIRVVKDDLALFQASDRWNADQRFSSIARIPVQMVFDAFNALTKI